MSAQPGSDNRTQAELLHDLRYGERQAQEDALARLSVVGEAEALDAVIDYLCDQPDGVRDSALNALRVLAYKYLPLDRYRLADSLIPFLTAENWSQRLTAARLLNVHPSELATENLRAMVREAQEKIGEHQPGRLWFGHLTVQRALAEGIMAMANCGRLAVLPDVIAYLDDSSLRPIAARALGLIGSETERDTLEDLVEDPDVYVRDAAQWALGLMDDRIEMLTNPPAEPPFEPPERLNMVYWLHRQLQADEDPLIQFLVVRVGIEHILLDSFLNESRVPEDCVITLRYYTGETPPDFRWGRAETIAMWRYHQDGPALIRLDVPSLRTSLPPGRPGIGARNVGVTISCPIDLPDRGEGLVSFDCLFGPIFGRGWHYRVARAEDGGWGFWPLRQTWGS